MGRNRYEKYSDPLTPVQKRELKHKEHKPDGEKRHLQIISYSNEKLIDTITNVSSTTFDKSIAKEEILRRLTRESKRKENRKPKNKDTKKSIKLAKKKQKKWEKFEQVAPKTGIHIGLDHHNQYDDFISGGGDPNSCPFD